MERVKNRDKLLKKYKESKLEVDHQIYREAKAEASNLIKGKNILNKRLLKTLFKTLNSLGLPSKKVPTPLFA